MSYLCDCTTIETVFIAELPGESKYGPGILPVSDIPIALTASKEQIGEPSTQDPVSTEKPPAKPKRKGCLLVFGIALFLLIGAVLFLSGPGFRFIGEYAALKAAESQGISGQLELRGNLWSGFSVHEVELEGNDSPLVKVSLEEAKVRYHFLDLVKNFGEFHWLDLFAVNNLHLHLKLPEGSEDSSSVKAEPVKGAQENFEATDFSPFWNLLDADFALNKISATIEVGEDRYEIEDLALTLPSEKDGRFTIETLRLAEIAEREGISISIDKGEHRLIIGSIPVIEGVALKRTVVAESSPGVFEVETEITADGTTLNANYSTAGKASLQMSDGQKLDLGRLIELANQDLPLSGELSQLDIQFEGDFAKPPTWKIDGSIRLSDVGWEKFLLNSAAVSLTGEKANLTLSAPGLQAVLDANVPLHLVRETSGLAKAPVSLGGEIAISSLKTLLEPVAPELPLDGVVEARISSFQIANGKTLQSGSALILSRNPSWDGQSIGNLQIAARVASPNRVELRADATLSEKNTVLVTADFNAADLTYEGKGTVAVETDDTLSRILAHFGADGKFRGALATAWTGKGSFTDKTHQGSLNVEFAESTLLDGVPFTGKISATYNESSASVPEISLVSEAISIKGTANWNGTRIVIPKLTATDDLGERLKINAELPFDPKSEDGFLDQTGPVLVYLEADDLAVSSLAGFAIKDLPIDGKLNGSMESEGTFLHLNSKADLSFIPDAKAAGEDSKLTLTLQHAGNISSPKTWDLNLDSTMTGLKWKETALEQMEMQADTVEKDGAKSLVATVQLNQSSAAVDAKASLGLSNAEDFSALAAEPVAIDATLLIERIDQLIQDFAPEAGPELALTGALSASLDGFELREGKLEKGFAKIQSETLAMADTQIGGLNITADVSAPQTIDATLTLPLDEKSSINGGGTYHLETGAYSGKLDIAADLKSKGKLRDLLADRNFAALLPSTTSMNWEGSGNVTDKKHQGILNAKGEGLSLSGGAPPISFSLAGNYADTAVEISELEVKSEPLNLSGTLSWNDKILSIPAITGSHAGRDVLSLAAEVPLDPEKLSPELWFQQETPLMLELTTDQLPVDEIMKMVQPKPPVLGNLNTDFRISGSPATPAIAANLDFSDVAVPQEEEDLPVGKLSVTLSAKGEKANLDGAFTHPDVNPFNLKADFPFLPGQWAAGTRKFPEEQISASVKMEESSLSFLTTQVPGIEDIAGTIALDVDLSGTVKEPKIVGNGSIDVDRLRLENRNAPSFYDINSAIRFADNTLTIDQFRAIVAGGIVELSGNATLDGESPRLDFTLTGKEVLVARTPDVNVRTDVDIRLAGPWEEAMLSGSLGITNSRFFKNVDLLPIGLPGRNKSVLPTVERVPSGGGPAAVDLDVGVPVEPFKNWPVDIRIYTKDPFLIRGNLAQSEIESDLKILGTLGKPIPKGVVNIAEGTLSLPFSTVDVEVGKIVFSEKTGFNGALEFKAQAKAGDYRINIYAFNRVLSPKHVLTSIPPIPPEDIMTLIATGTTRDDFTGSDAGSVAASKAAMLFLKNLKKSGAGVDREPSLLDKLQDRTELEVGKVNPETGEQTFGGKVRLWKQLFFVGDVDSQSDYRALLKYVFEFR